MEFYLLITGVMLLVVALVAAGLAVAGILVPLLEDGRAQMTLAFLGIALIVASRFVDQADMGGSGIAPTNTATAADRPVGIGHLPTIPAPIATTGISDSSVSHGEPAPRLDDQFLAGAVDSPASRRGNPDR